MMAVKESLESLNILLSEMRYYLLKAGIPKYQVRVRNQKHQFAALARAFDWLHNIKLSYEYKQFVYAWNLVPEQIWDRYKLHKITGLQEQDILEKASVALQQLWRIKRPRIFNRDIKKVPHLSKKSRGKR